MFMTGHYDYSMNPELAKSILLRHIPTQALGKFSDGALVRLQEFLTGGNQNLIGSRRYSGRASGKAIQRGIS